MITVKINVSKVLKEHLFQGKNGKMLDLVLFENKAGRDRFDNDGIVVQDLGKEARERGEKSEIIGNYRIIQTKQAAAPVKPVAQKASAQPADDSDSEVPF